MQDLARHLEAESVVGDDVEAVLVAIIVDEDDVSAGATVAEEEAVEAVVVEEEDAVAGPSSTEAAARVERAARADSILEKTGRLRAKMIHMASAVVWRE